MAEKPMMILEIKRSVNGGLSQVAYGDLVQTLLESCYCGLQYDLQRITACLTDVATWHFLDAHCYPKSKHMLSVDGSTSILQKDNDYSDLVHLIGSIILKGIEDEF